MDIEYLRRVKSHRSGQHKSERRKGSNLQYQSTRLERGVEIMETTNYIDEPFWDSEQFRSRGGQNMDGGVLTNFTSFLC